MPQPYEVRQPRMERGPSGYAVRFAYHMNFNVSDSGARNVLEIGVGEARNLLPFAEQGWQLFGADSDPLSIKLSTENLNRNGVAEDQFDLQLLDLTDETTWPTEWTGLEWNAIMALAVIQQIPFEQVADAVGLATRQLAPEGRMLLSVHHDRNKPGARRKPHRADSFSEQELRTIGAAAGLEVEYLESRPKPDWPGGTTWLGILRKIGATPIETFANGRWLEGPRPA